MIFYSLKNMFKRGLLLFCSFFCLHLNTNPPFEKDFHSHLASAEDLFEANLYKDAITQYTQALNLIEEKQASADFNQQLIDEISQKIQHRLSHAFFNDGNYEKSVYYLKKIKKGAADEYLLAIALRNNNELKDAIAILLNLYENENVFSKKNEFFFELGVTHYQNNQIDQAKMIFKELSLINLPLLKNKALLYLARIESENNDPQLAFQHLKAINILSDQEALANEYYFVTGEIFYKAGFYKNAIDAFEKYAVVNKAHDKNWQEDALYYLGSSYLKLGASENSLAFFNQALKHFENLTNLYPNDRSWNSLVDCYLSKGYSLNDDLSFLKAKDITEKKSLFSKDYAENTLPILQACSEASFNQRDVKFRHLTNLQMEKETFYELAWYFRGINEYKEALLLKKQNNTEYQKLFDRSIASLNKSIPLLLKSNPILAGKSYLLLAKIEKESNRKALIIKNLNHLFENQYYLLNILDDPMEALIFYANIQENYELAKEKLEFAIKAYPHSSLKSEALKLLGTLHYQNKSYEKAYAVYEQIVEESDEIAPTALLWMCYCLEKCDSSPKSSILSLKKKITEQYPLSKEAEIADFNLYSYQDYLQSDRLAIKHLNAFLNKYPNSPLIMNAHFLIGLDFKRDRKKADGKKITLKNLTKAIDHFQMAENQFSDLLKKGLLPEDKIEHYLLVKYRSQLEKALANFALAGDSIGSKKNIYLEFSKDILHQLYDELNSKDILYEKTLYKLEAFWHLKEETAIVLAQSYISLSRSKEAENILENQIKNYEKSKISRGYFLSRTYSQLGFISFERKDYEKALSLFLKAEESATGKLLSSEQQLQLWIEQSNCQKELKNYDQAILILSKAVNDDTASSLRIKAMFLRALVNEKQERFELAKKQLIATSKMGGEWALKAKDKLEEGYGYK